MGLLVTPRSSGLMICLGWRAPEIDRKSTRLNSSHSQISYATDTHLLSLHDALPILFFDTPLLQQYGQTTSCPRPGVRALPVHHGASHLPGNHLQQPRPWAY